MSIKNRLQQLEKRRKEQPNTPAIIEIYGARMDGTTYLSERLELKDGRFVTVEKPAVRILIPDNGRGDVQ